MERLAGQWIPLSLARRLVCDVVHFGRKVPSVPIQRRIDVSALRQARGCADPSCSWTAIFLKAFALVAARHPELRRSYLPFPWPHLYQCPINVAIVAVEREIQSEKMVFFGRVRFPERKSLAEIDGFLDWLGTAPVETINTFRESLRFSRLPRPLRRTLWSLALNLSGNWRARRLGTFGLSVFSALGADSYHPVAPISNILTYDVIGPDGKLNVRLVSDHRVLDGATVARALGRLEEVLHTEILGELESRSRVGRANRPAAA